MRRPQLSAAARAPGRSRPTLLGIWAEEDCNGAEGEMGKCEGDEEDGLTI